MIEYILTRTKRKTIGLTIRNGRVEVRAPMNVPKRDINAAVASKAEWIEKRLVASVERLESKAAFEVNYGSLIAYRGKTCRVVGVPGQRVFFEDDCFCVPLNLEPAQVKAACVQIHKLVAKRDLTMRTHEFAAKMNAPFLTTIRVTSATMRWGSCSSKRSINYAWRLIMADDDVIDYVIVHELAHLTEMNHSERFWAIVADVLPDYEERREKLKAFQQKINLEDWET